MPFALQSILASNVPVESVGCIFGPSRRTGHGGAFGGGPEPPSDSSPLNPVVSPPPFFPLVPLGWLGTTKYCIAFSWPATAASSTDVSFMNLRRSYTGGGGGVDGRRRRSPVAGVVAPVPAGGAGGATFDDTASFVPPAPAFAFLGSMSVTIPASWPSDHSRLSGSFITRRETPPSGGITYTPGAGRVPFGNSRAIRVLMRLPSLP